MRELEGEFERARINVRFVVIGSPELAAEFCGRFGDPARCIADPEKRTYAAMGLENYALWKLPFDPALRRRRAENKAAGFRQNWRATRIENAAQLPGAALFDADGLVRWTHRGTHPGDLPPMAEMLATARAALSRTA
ncbi:MAG: AhpC/TSA family protein [Candidatus Eremiobacteraeota bacterium]|nr:AhpC/TSA family protein [Candidatus Eremiobacteraeota bacterium]